MSLSCFVRSGAPVAFLGCLLVCSACAVAQGPAPDPFALYTFDGPPRISGNVSRIVEGPEGAIDTVRVPGATVWLEGSLDVVTADSTGGFFFPEVIAGPITLRAQYGADEGGTIVTARNNETAVAIVILGVEVRDITDLSYDPAAGEPGRVPPRGRSRRGGG